MFVRIPIKCFVFFLLLLAAAPPVRAELRYDEILGLSEQEEPAALKFMREKGGQIYPVGEGRTFIVWWTPEGFDPKKDPVLLSLHGHAGWAAKDFQVWHPYLEGRRYAYMGLQWWYGRSEEPVGYAKPQEIYRWAREALEERKIPKKHVVFQGFSRGSAISYAVTFIDRVQSEPYFAVTISNAGQMEEDYPPNRGFLELPETARPFAGARWIIYCGGKDPQRGCVPMKQTKEKLESMGAEITAFLEDPQGDHGGFMKRGGARQALDLADKIFSEITSR